MTNKFSSSAILFGICICGLASLSSCLSLATFEDAKVLDKGKSELGAHAGLFDNPDNSNDFLNPESSVDFGFYGRAGIGNNLQITGRINTQFSVSANLKYQFLNSQNGLIAGATGIGFGGLLGYINTGNPAMWVDIPLIFSIYPNDKFCWYGSAHYLLISGAETEGFVYATSGIKVGKKYGLMIESNFVPRWNDLLNTGQIPSIYLGHQQVHAGAFFRF